MKKCSDLDCHDMIQLTVRAQDIDDLICNFDFLKKQIAEGYTSGSLMDGWNLSIQ